MANRSVLTDSYLFGFTPQGSSATTIDLAGALVSWNDVIAIRVARHEYLKRDGAEQEPMGASPGRFTMRCTFTGPDWASRYRNLVVAIRREPRGVMTHPILGKIRVVCTGIPSAEVNPPQQIDTVDFSLTFEEDALDTALSVEDQAGPAVQQQKVSDLSGSLTTAVAPYTTAVGSVASLTTSAQLYATSAVASVNTATADVTLQQQLNAVGQLSSSAITSVRADPLSTSDAVSYPVVALIEQLYAACQDLDAAIASRMPQISQFTVGGTVSLAVLSAQLYGGKDAAARRDEIRINNRLPNEYAIPAGTVLQIAQRPGS